MSDLHNLQRFLDAQNPVYEQVCGELRAKRKRTHWMWFIFPQLRGLGQSSMSIRYGISGPEEAEAYLKHPILGARLRECTQLVTAVEGRSLGEIFGYPDDMKFKSSMTLFAGVAKDDPVFQRGLQLK